VEDYGDCGAGNEEAGRRAGVVFEQPTSQWAGFAFPLAINYDGVGIGAMAQSLGGWGSVDDEKCGGTGVVDEGRSQPTGSPVDDQVAGTALDLRNAKPKLRSRAVQGSDSFSGEAEEECG